MHFKIEFRDLKDREILKQRTQYVEAVLNLPPTSKPNSKYEYSNSGFVVAGAMLEQVTGKPWESLIEERIFEPLGMTDSGFGNAAREDRNSPTQPWPHKNGTTPFPPGNGDDNSWVIGPAGTVHCSLKDISRYISMHAAREIGPILKKAETYEFLHTAVPENDNYARGWIVSRAPWAQGSAIAHDGNNTMNHCSIWIAPERNAAVAAFTNNGENGAESCRSAIQAVVAKYLK
ncbi:MAG: D-alanyl-D-alanine carboxypeptidase [Verrucomicrobiales bacterium]